LEKWIPKAERLLKMVSASEPARDVRIVAQNADLAKGLDSQTIVGIQSLNRMRMACGMRPLLIDRKLCEAAHGHSKDMKEWKFFAHISPVPGKKTPYDRAKLAGTTAWGENIAHVSTSSVVTVKCWFLSPGHHKAMLFPHFTHMGLGHDGSYWTLMVGGYDGPGKLVRTRPRPAETKPGPEGPQGPEAPQQPETPPESPESPGDSGGEEQAPDEPSDPGEEAE
jgi:hypothetical protein